MDSLFRFQTAQNPVSKEFLGLLVGRAVIDTYRLPIQASLALTLIAQLPSISYADLIASRSPTYQDQFRASEIEGGS